MYLYSNDAAKENQRRADIEEKFEGKIGTWDATWGQFNPFWDFGQAQDEDGNVLHSKKFERDPNWKFDGEQARADGLGFMTIYAAADRGDLVSQASYNALVQRVQLDRDQKEVLSANHGLLNFAAAIPAFLSNPVNLPELAIAVTSGGTTLATRLAVGAALAGTTGYVDESVRQARSGLIDENAKAQITAFSTIFGGVANGVLGKRASLDNTVLKQNLEEGTVVPPGSAWNTSTVDKIVDENGKLVDFDGVIPQGSSYAYSMIGGMAASESNSARQLGARLQISGASTVAVAGTYMGDTAHHIAREIESTLSRQTGIIKDIRRQNFKNVTEAEWNEMVYVGLVERNAGKTIDPALAPAVDAFETGLRHVGLKLEGAGMASKGKGYVTREFDGHKMRAMGRETVQEYLGKAIYKKAAAKFENRIIELNKKIEKLTTERNLLPARTRTGTKEWTQKQKLKKEINGHKKELKNGSLSQKAADKRAGEVYDSVVNDEMGHGADSLRRRKLDVYEDDILDILNRNAGDILQKQSFRMSGRIGVKEALGFHTTEELASVSAQLKKRVYDEMKKAGHTEEKARKEAIKMAEYFERNVRLLWGTQMKSTLPAWAQMTTKGIMDLNFATIGGGFAATAAMGELALPIVMAGFKVGLKSIGHTFKDIKRIYKEQVPSNRDNAQMQLWTHGFDKTNHSIVARVANDLEEGYAQQSWLNKKLAKATEFVANTLPLSTVTTAARNSIGIAMMDDIFFNPKLIKQLDVWEATGKMSGDLKKLTRLQFDIRRLKEIQAKADDVFKYDKKGDLVEYDLTKLDDSDRAMLQRGLSNASDLNVLMGDKKHLPHFWSNPNNVGLKLATQFMSYPLQAYESLLLRGYDERSAAMIVGITTSAFFTGIIAMSKEEILIASGAKKEADRKFDLATSEGMQNLAVKMLATNSILAPLSMGMDMMKKVMTGEGLGSDYRMDTGRAFLGPTYSRVNDILASLHKLDLNPMDGNDNAWNTTWGRTLMMNSGLPFYTIPLVGDGLKSLNEYWAK